MKSAPHTISNAGAFNELFHLYHDPLVGYAASYLRNREDAEDVVQDVFVRIWDMRQEICPDKSLKSLLFTATKNQCISLLRSRIHRDAQELHKIHPADLQLKIDLIALEYSTLETIEFEDLQGQISAILASLPEDHRRFFLMNREEGMQYTDIAKSAGISVKTVEKKMSATLRIFRHKLKEYNFLLFFW